MAQVLDTKLQAEFTKAKLESLELYQKNKVAGVLAFRSLVSKYNSVAEAHYLLSIAVETENPTDTECALTHALLAHKYDPDAFDYIVNLAELYGQLDLPELAIPLLRCAVTLEAANSKTFQLLGNCLQNMAMGQEALQFLNKALELCTNQESRVEIMLDHASASSVANRSEDALKTFVTVSRMRTRESFGALARAALECKEGLASDLGRAINVALSNKSLSDQDRALTLLAKGKLLERDRKYDLAFSAWEGARKYSKKLDWKVRDHEEEFNVRKDFYGPILNQNLISGKNLDFQLAVICGMPRSGTTLTEQILSSHSRAAGIGEFGRWSRLERHFRDDDYGNDPSSFTMSDKSASHVEALARETHEVMLSIIGRASELIVEKLPHNFMHAGFIRLLFPKTRFIHIRRHPLDSFISSFQNPLSQAHGYAYDQVEYAKEYIFHERMMELWKSIFPAQILTIHYEELALNPELKARELIEFVGLDWEAQVLEFYKSDRTVRTISKDQVRNPVYTNSVSRWKRYQRHLGPIMQELERVKFVYPEFT